MNYLERALRSIVEQDDPNWQAHVSDDGPEPGAEELVRSFGDSRIRYFKNERNIGMGANFNRCIDLAQTDLVTIVHNDDELMPDYCRTFRAAADRYPNAAALFCRVFVIRDDSRSNFSVPDFIKDHFINPSTKREVVLEGEPGVRALLRGNFINAPTLCFRKSILGDRRFENLKFVLDIALTTQLLLDGETLVGLPNRCYRYRRHEEAATSQYTRSQLRFQEESDFYDRMRDISHERGWTECERLSRQKRIVKLNIAYRALKNVALGELKEAKRGFSLLRTL